MIQKFKAKMTAAVLTLMSVTPALGGELIINTDSSSPATKASSLNIESIGFH